MNARDLRGLPPPEPMEIILAHADEMNVGAKAAFVLPHVPTPLLPLLPPGIAHRCELSGDGGVILRLERTA